LRRSSPPAHWERQFLPIRRDAPRTMTWWRSEARTSAPASRPSSTAPGPGAKMAPRGRVRTRGQTGRLGWGAK
jgi:hypothetical protein